MQSRLPVQAVRAGETPSHDDEPEKRRVRRGSPRAGAKVEPSDERATPPTSSGGKVDWAAYRPGDVLGYVLHGTPGFEALACPASFAELARSEDAVAAAGMTGTPRPLPHRRAIQAAFGRHDVTQIEAHVGGPAADAAGHLGAIAYAAGGSVAFADEPDLHTAAHEAAHVVQQRQGVARKAAGGGATDAHEQHADAVADLVVAGRSAEGLLSAGPAGAASVQRKATAAAGSCHPSNGPMSQDAMNATLAKIAVLLDAAALETNILGQLVDLLIDQGGEIQTAADKAVANTAEMSTARAASRDRDSLACLGKFLLGLAEAALGIAELMSGNPWGGGLKIAKGTSVAAGAISGGSDEGLEQRLAATARLVAALAEQQNAIIRLFALHEAHHIVTNLDLAQIDIDLALKSIATSNRCGGPDAYPSEYVDSVTDRLPALSKRARSIHAAALHRAVVIKAAGSVGPAAMHESTPTRKMFNVVRHLLESGRASELELIENRSVRTVTLLERQVVCGNEPYRAAVVELRKHKTQLVTNQAVRDELGAQGIACRQAAKVLSSRDLQYTFDLQPERVRALEALTDLGLRPQRHHRVDYALDRPINVVARSLVDDRPERWMYEPELAALWKEQVQEVVGFTYAGHAYRFEGGRFVAVDAR